MEPDERGRRGQPGAMSVSDRYAARAAMVQGATFGVLFGLVDALINGSHRTVGTDVVVGAVSAIAFGVVMFAVGAWRRRRG